MQDRKYPPKKLSEWDQVWFRRGWLWNVEAGLPEILTAGPWNQVTPNFRNEFSRRGERGQVKDRSCSSLACPWSLSPQGFRCGI